MLKISSKNYYISAKIPTSTMFRTIIDTLIQSLKAPSFNILFSFLDLEDFFFKPTHGLKTPTLGENY